MNGDFDLQGYLTKGVETVVADAVKATLKNPKESAFMLRFAASSAAASKKRRINITGRKHYKKINI